MRLAGMLVVLVMACTSPAQDLRVDIRTDFVPGLEFREALITFEGRSLIRAPQSADDWLDGIAAGSFENIETGGLVEVELRADSGATVVERRIRVRASDRVITVILSRDCAGVSCPEASDASATECLGGRCVSPDCSPENPGACPPAQCMSASECPAPSMCGDAVCSLGVCLVGGGSECAADEVCIPETGCRPRVEPMDAGVDVGTDAMDATDSEPDAPIELEDVRVLWPVNGYATGSIHVPSESTIVNHPLRPWVQWQAVSGASDYEVQWTSECSRDDFATCPFDTVDVDDRVDATRHRPSAELAVRTVAPVGLIHVWRVRACAGDVCSEWSTPRYIQVGHELHDYNGDGYADVAFVTSAGATHSLRIRRGSAAGLGDPTLVAENPAGGLVAVGSAGDVDGDGYADMFVGAPDEGAGGRGALLLVSGGPDASATAEVVPPDGTPSTGFGTKAVGVGDLNADGYADLVVTDPERSDPELEEGGLVVYLGSSTGLADGISIPSPDAELGGRFGFRIAAAGDINADGYADFMAMGFGSDGSGTVYVFHGGPTVSTTPSATIPSPGAESWGFRLVSIGDVDRDGYDDILISSPEEGSAMGALYLYLGGRDGIQEDVPQRIELAGAADDTELGRWLTVGADADGDGYFDVLATSPNASQAPSRRHPAGVIGLTYFLSRPALEPMFVTLLAPRAARSFAGEVAYVGDVSGDGLAEYVGTSDGLLVLYEGREGFSPLHQEGELGENNVVTIGQ